MEVTSTSEGPWSESADVLVDHFDHFKIIDVIAPERVKILSGGQKAAWRLETETERHGDL